MLISYRIPNSMDKVILKVKSAHLQSNGAIREEADLRSFGQFLATTAHPFAHSRRSVSLRSLVRTAAAANDEPGAGMGELCLEGCPTDQQQQDSTPKRDANAGQPHRPS